MPVRDYGHRLVNQFEPPLGLAHGLHRESPDMGRLAHVQTDAQPHPFVGERQVLKLGEIKPRAKVAQPLPAVAKVTIVCSGRQPGKVEFDAEMQFRLRGNAFDQVGDLQQR